MAKKTTGRIFTSGKKGFYYLRYKVNGKDNRVRLMDTGGKPITSKAEAQAAANRILAHIHESDRTEQLRKLKNDIQDAEEAAVIAELNMRNAAASIDKGWELFMTCSSRLKSCKRYSAGAIPKDSTADSYRAYYSHFVEWMKEHYPKVYRLSDVTPAIADEFAGELQKTLAAGTVNKYRFFFIAFFNTLNKDGKISIDRNPFATMERMEADVNSRRELSIPELQRIIETAEGDLKLLLQVGTFTGLRLGDCCTLLWNEIDLARGIIRRKPRKTSRKTGALVTLGIPVPLFQALNAVPETERSGYLLPRFAELYLAPHGTGAVTRIIQRHFKACGIELYAPGTGAKYHYEGKKKVYDESRRAVLQVGFHSLRHTWISFHAMHGTPQAVIQQAAGHANPAMTEHYTHVSEEAARIAAHAFDIPQLVGETIDVTPVPEPEREELRKIADSWSIEQVRELLKFSEHLKEKR